MVNVLDWLAQATLADSPFPLINGVPFDFPFGRIQVSEITLPILRFIDGWFFHNAKIPQPSPLVEAPA
jgi:hypothetical protein